MNEHWVDRLSKTLAAGPSRRDFLRLAGAAVVGLLVADAPVAEAQKKPVKCTSDLQCPSRLICGPKKKCICVTDAHCPDGARCDAKRGKCVRVCFPQNLPCSDTGTVTCCDTLVCCGGTCQKKCQCASEGEPWSKKRPCCSGLEQCDTGLCAQPGACDGGFCSNTGETCATSNECCGNLKCCADSKCAPTCPGGDPQPCSTTADCTTLGFGSACCGGFCVSLLTNNQHCGACTTTTSDHRCGESQTCQNGSCTCAQPLETCGKTCCDNGNGFRCCSTPSGKRCIDIAYSATNCGGCDLPCDVFAGELCCNQKCVNIKTGTSKRGDSAPLWCGNVCTRDTKDVVPLHSDGDLCCCGVLVVGGTDPVHCGQCWRGCARAGASFCSRESNGAYRCKFPDGQFDEFCDSSVVHPIPDECKSFYPRSAPAGGVCCAPGKVLCNGQCRDCCEDVDCPSGKTCNDWVCGCPVGKKPCGDRCVDAAGCCADGDCTGGKVCRNDVCVDPPSTCNPPCTALGEKCCGGRCVNSLYDPRNCYTCGNQCPAERPCCVFGACQTRAGGCDFLGGGNWCCLP